MLSRVVCGGRPGTPQGPGSQAHVIGGWSVVAGGLPPASLCAWPAAARPGAVPLLGVRWLLLPGLSRPPAPGLWRSFRAGQRVGCPPWFMPWLSRCLAGWVGLWAWPSFGFRGPLPRPVLCSVGALSSPGFGVGGWAQGRRPGRVGSAGNPQSKRPCDGSPSATVTNKAHGGRAGCERPRPIALPSGPVGLALRRVGRPPDRWQP